MIFQTTLYTKTSDPAPSAILKTLDTVLRELLSLWFTVGLLDVQRITWESPCNMLQKVGSYVSLFFPLSLYILIILQCQGRVGSHSLFAKLETESK